MRSTDAMVTTTMATACGSSSPGAAEGAAEEEEEVEEEDWVVGGRWERPGGDMAPRRDAQSTG